MDKKIRINKFLSQKGFCSRREADKFILDERVTINGIIAKMGKKLILKMIFLLMEKEFQKKSIKKSTLF